VRFSIVIIGCAAVALVACGGAGSASGGAPASKASPSPARGAAQNGVAGQITQLGGGTLVVKEPSADVSVAYSAATNVLQTSSATQANILAGACVVVTGQRDSGGVVTADMVQVQFNMNGNCTPPPGVGQATPGPGNAVNIRGKITSVSGTSFVAQPVTAGDPPVTVNVPSTARITRLDTATTSRLAVGQCVRVNGQQAASGVVQARALVITPAGPNGCVAAGPGAGGQPRPSSSAAPAA
jgi:Domain of unknown function (DUF5666)